MSWGEALRLTRILNTDPSSMVAAAVAGWAFPVTREYIAAKTAADNYVMVKTAKKGSKLSVLPAPWDVPKRRGTASMPYSQMLKVLEYHRAHVNDAKGVPHG
jgi:hypothetical protein